MIKKLQLQGTAKEIGYEHGSQGKKSVHCSLETYEKLFRGYKNITWSEAKERAMRHLTSIERYDSDMIEEMEGIANGASVEFEDILALNARSEIALAEYKGKSFNDGCTAMATMNPITPDTIIGQTWDWKASQKKSLLLLDIQGNSNPAITMITEGGIIGKIGFNSAGVGVCFNALITDKKSDEIPIHLGLRAVLNSYSLTEAVSKVKGGQMASAASFLIGYDQGDGNGMAVNAEVSPVGMEYVEDDRGILVHTNHVCSNEIKKSIEDRNEFKYDDSILRKKRAEQLVQRSIANKELIDERSFEKWLSDEFNAPNSINHFENKNAPEHRRVETVFSIIVSLSKRQAFLREGNSSEAVFEKIEAVYH